MKAKAINKVGAGKIVYWILFAVMLFPTEMLSDTGKPLITPPIALFAGLLFAAIFGSPVAKFNKKTSKYLLQAAVVGLGFGMNLYKSLASGADGMLFTIVSVAGVMLLGVMVGKWLAVDAKTSYLVSSGTAICGGSAIAAIGGVLKADSNQMAVSLGVVFILNAVALFIFPPIGHMLDMSQQQFGTWAAIAIHDTSSVVGAGQAYGAQACEVATLIKCTRALWIIPLAFFTMWYFRKSAFGADGVGKAKVNIPWFIVLFVLAMVINTYSPDSWQPFYTSFASIAKKALTVVMFCIGAGLSLKVIKSVGVKPLVQALILWVAIGVASLLVVNITIE